MSVIIPNFVWINIYRDSKEGINLTVMRYGEVHSDHYEFIVKRRFKKHMYVVLLVESCCFAVHIMC